MRSCGCVLRGGVRVSAINWETMTHAEYKQAMEDGRADGERRLAELQEAMGITAPKARKPYERSSNGRQPEAD